jgi:hypothetical protein
MRVGHFLLVGPWRKRRRLRTMLRLYLLKQFRLFLLRVMFPRLSPLLRSWRVLLRRLGELWRIRVRISGRFRVRRLLELTRDRPPL